MGCKCNDRKLVLKIKYHADITEITSIDIGDWHDLRCAEKTAMRKGDFKYINLGISVQIPSGYEMHIAPRSSTFKKFGVIQTNSPGIIDESYNGDGDILKFPAFAMRDTIIPFDARICQFRLVKKQPEIEFVRVDTLGNENRGGLGSTGIL